MASPRFEIFGTEEELAAGAAARVLDRLRQALALEGRATVALSGGSTPAPLYRRLGAAPAALAWKRVELFWADERCVPPEHPESNFRLARETFLDPLGLAGDTVHRIRGELPPEDAAARYEAELAAAFAEDPPRFDLALLGVGTDGHTASLFPGGPELAEVRRRAVATRAPEAPRDRVSLTLPVLDAARAALFLVAGERKAEIVARILAGGGEARDLPAARVRPPRGELLWLLDEAAASRLPGAARKAPAPR
jgi:6-phosphogluconolactonase